MYRPLTTLAALARSTPRSAPRHLLRHSSSKSVSTTPNHQQASGLSYGAGALAALVVGTALVVRVAEKDGGRAARAAAAAAPPPSPPTPSSSSSSPADADAEANPQAAAYDPVTGEINWDCPCLGGMADGPCGEQFKAAFSCFVYSEVEPKGVDCVEKFRGMQECFRKYPEIYGADGDEEEEDEEVLIERAEAFLAMDDDEFKPSTTA